MFADGSLTVPPTNQYPNRVKNTYLPPPHVPPPQGTTVPPQPGGNRHQVTVPPPKGGGTLHHSRPANSSITQPKFFFSAFGACDFLLISYCSWAK